jgi:hypothetical protein
MARRSDVIFIWRDHYISLILVVENAFVNSAAENRLSIRSSKLLTVKSHL